MSVLLPLGVASASLARHPDGHEALQARGPFAALRSCLRQRGRRVVVQRDRAAQVLTPAQLLVYQQMQEEAMDGYRSMPRVEETTALASP